MKPLIALLFLLNTLNFAHSQSIDCNRALNKTPNFHKSSNVSANLFAEDIKIIKDCGGFTDADSVLLSRPILGTISVKISAENHLTYKMVINELQIIKNSSYYREMLALNELGKKKIAMTSWEKDKVTLIRLFEGSEDELGKFKEFLIKNQGLFLNYKQAFSGFMANGSSVNTTKKSKKAFDFRPFIDLPSALSKAKKEGKTLLISFSAYGSIPSARMLNELLSDSNITKFLAQNFTCYVGFVDDVTKLPLKDQVFSKVLNKKMLTVGDQLKDLQGSHFKSEVQPYFAILSYEGQVLKQSSGYHTTSDLMNFINSK